MNSINIKLWQSVIMTGFFNQTRLKPTSRLILIILICHMNSKSGLIFPALKTLAFEAGCDEKQVCRAIKELEAKDIIFIKKQYWKKVEHNYYYFTDTFSNKLEGLKNNTTGKMPVPDVVNPVNLSAFGWLSAPETTGKKTEKHINKHFNKQNNNFSENFECKTPFQKENEYIFKILNKEELRIYQSVEPYNKQEWLNEKWKIYQTKLRNDELLAEIKESKKKAVPPPPDLFKQFKTAKNK